MEPIKQQIQTYNWLGIFKHHKKKRSVFEGPPATGKIAPFGESFFELASAVVLKGKPIAEFDYGIYNEEKSLFDHIIKIYGLEKLDDPANLSVWFFRPENRADALGRIAELTNRTNRLSSQRGGELYGYSQCDIDAFLINRIENSIPA